MDIGLANSFGNRSGEHIALRSSIVSEDKGGLLKLKLNFIRKLLFSDKSGEWTNKDNADHDVTSNSGLFFSPTMGKNAKFSYKFDAIGTYDYNCTFHNGMKGKIIVR